MAYSSDLFLLSLPVILIAFYLAESRALQNALLGVASLCFLGWTGVSSDDGRPGGARLSWSRTDSTHESQTH